MIVQNPKNIVLNFFQHDFPSGRSLEFPNDMIRGQGQDNWRRYRHGDSAL